MHYLTGDTQAEHDTIAKFRRENFDTVSACFVHVLELAQELKLLKVGTVSVDGTTLKANASKNRKVGYDRAGELVEQLESEVPELIRQAERVDQRDEADGQSLPEEIARHERLEVKLEQARPRVEEPAQKRAQAQQLGRKHDFRPRATEEKQAPQIRSKFVREIKQKMERTESREK